MNPLVAVLLGYCLGGTVLGALMVLIGVVVITTMRVRKTPETAADHASGARRPPPCSKPWTACTRASGVTGF